MRGRGAERVRREAAARREGPKGKGAPDPAALPTAEDFFDVLDADEDGEISHDDFDRLVRRLVAAGAIGREAWPEGFTEPQNAALALSTELWLASGMGLGMELELEEYAAGERHAVLCGHLLGLFAQTQTASSVQEPAPAGE